MWRRPLEWNLNGTTDPRDGSVDHLSLNSLRDRHGPIRAPKSRSALIKAASASSTLRSISPAASRMVGRGSFWRGGLFGFLRLRTNEMTRAGTASLEREWIVKRRSPVFSRPFHFEQRRPALGRRPVSPRLRPFRLGQRQDAIDREAPLEPKFALVFERFDAKGKSATKHP